MNDTTAIIEYGAQLASQMEALHHAVQEALEDFNTVREMIHDLRREIAADRG